MDDIVERITYVILILSSISLGYLINEIKHMAVERRKNLEATAKMLDKIKFDSDELGD